MMASSPPPGTPDNISSGYIAVAEKPYSPVEIDVSCSSPLVLLFASAVLWLAVGTFLNLLAAIKFHSPAMFANVAWLTFGRVRPAGMDALLYGFASQAAMGIIIWLNCRLGGITLCCKAPVILATAFWNVGVTVGVLGVVAGSSTGFGWLEMPRFSQALLFASYSVIALCVLVTFHNRIERKLYVSQWYLLAALFWFPWLLSAANLLLLYWPVRGVLQAFINAWFTNGLLTLWLMPVVLATLFYFIPKLLIRPLYSNYIAGFGFWTYIVVAGWTVSIPLMGGPFPAWMVAIGTSAAIVLIVPTVAVAFNWYMTVAGLKLGERDKGDVILRCVVFAALTYFLISAGGILLGSYQVSAITQFSLVPLAMVYLFIFGLVGMTAFAVIYYIIPRATRLEWPSVRLIRWHYTCSVIGIALVFVPLLVGGLIQGYRLNQTVAPVAGIARGTIPFVGVSAIGFLVLLAGQVAFLKNLFTLLHRQAAPVRVAAVRLFIPEPARVGGKP